MNKLLLCIIWAFALVLVCQQASADLFITNDITNRSIAANDWGNIFHDFPDFVLFPSTDADVAQALAWARSRRYGVTVRGTGHAAAGQSQCRKCVVINLARMNKVRAVSNTFVEVEAGAGMRVALEALRPLGRTTPAQTDWQGIALGGHASTTSGLGPASFTASSVHDNWLSATVVTGRGQILTVSPTSNPRLFDAVRSGMGQFGVITAIRLRAVPLPGSMIRVYRVYQSLANVAADYNKFLAQGTPMPFHQWETFPILNFPGTGAGVDPRYADYSSGLPGLWVAVQEYGVFYNPGNEPNDSFMLSQFNYVPGSAQISDIPYYDWVYRLDFVFDVILRQVGAWYNPHPWFEVMLPLETAFNTINNLLAQTSPADVPIYSVQSIIPLKKPTRPGSYQLLPESEADYYVYFGLLRSSDIGTGATEDRFPEAVRLLDINSRLRTQVIQAGGMPVVSSTLPTNPDEWELVMGCDMYDSFVRDKRFFDPTLALGANWNIVDRQGDDCNSFDRL